jgi:hypothetical protein
MADSITPSPELVEQWMQAHSTKYDLARHAAQWGAAAALAQHEPEEPTDKELHQLWQELYSFHDGPTSGEVAEIARAVLARWGRPTIEPVPVAERLPGPGDCDTEGECWWWHPDHKEDEFSDGWMLLKPKWADGHHDADDSPVHTHWLPHHALPVPQQGE